MTDEEIAFVHESVATATTASEMARAGLRWRFRQPRVRRTLVIGWILLTLLWSTAYDDDLSVASRLLSAGLFAGLFVVIVTIVMIPLGYVITRRNVAEICAPGTVMRSGFGSHDYVISNPMSSSRISYQGVRSIEVHDRFVFVRLVGSPLTRIYPSELFPPEEVERVAEVVAHRQGGVGS